MSESLNLKYIRDPAWRAFEREQRKYISQNSSPEQRLAWLEEMLRFLQDRGVTREHFGGHGPGSVIR